MCCASGSPCRGRRTPASRVSAARARCTSTASWSARAWCWPDRRRGARSSRSRGSPRGTGCIPCRMPLSRRGRCSAGSARPGSSSPRTICSGATPGRPTRRSGSPSPATSAAARATRRSWTPCASRRSGPEERESGGRRMRSAETVPTRERPSPPTSTPGRIGDSPVRPDGVEKVKGEFTYSSDLWADGMLWGATLRSPHPRANIWSIDTSAAEAVPGVYAVLTHEDVPGRKTYGLERPDQPVLAWEKIRYEGEPIALVAADHPETARRAIEKIEVDYEVLEPVTDPEAAISEDAPRLHPSGNILRHVRVKHGDPESAAADVVVEDEYEVGMQDQAFLGPESGLAVPDGQGGVDLYISTQWLHVDRDQLAASLDLPPERVRLTLSGVGGAFGAREDLSMQVHACLLALHTGRPVKMMYGREESFYGHVHRHPARMRYEHGATKDGRLVYVKARFVLDSGAYASSSTVVCSNVACFACGPYEVPNALVDSYVIYTNNPPCGAMRGFGA